MDPFMILKRMKTLLVDDDELVRNSISLAFSNKGCFLIAAETAEEGLRALEKEHFDIVISDFRLPVMNGLEFFKLATASHPKTLNIILTAYRDKNITSEAFEIGVHDVIDKPCSINVLVNVLVGLLENGKGKQSGLHVTAQGRSRVRG